MDIENHPIPQDITGFQFKLIGSMTVKQFAFLALGSILAYITYILPIPAFIKMPASGVFAFSGIFFAFIPVSGRPASLMLSYYIKSLFSSDQYVYQKKGGDLSFLLSFNPATENLLQASSLSKAKFEMYLANTKTPSKNKYDQKEIRILASIASIQASLQQVPFASTSIPKNGEAKANGQDKNLQNIADKILTEKPKEAPRIISQEVLEKIDKEQNLKEENSNKTSETKSVTADDLGKTKKEKDQKDAWLEEAKKRSLELQGQLEEALAEKTRFEEELISLKKKAEMENLKTFSPSQGKTTQETPSVRKIPKTMVQKTGLIAPDVPNVISGIVKDPRGNVLPNILIEIKDKNGNPVRAFKTNQLGQFASATSLADESYIIEIEDPLEKHKFDSIELIINGQIIEPLEIISTDQREELRRELFGGTN